METNNLKLKKFNLEVEANDTMNVETYFNNNWQKIDDTVGNITSLQTTNKQSITTAMNEIKEGVDKNKKQIEDRDTLPFEMDRAVESYPVGAKGLFSIEIDGVEPMSQKIENGDVITSLTSDNTGSFIHIAYDGTWSFNGVYDGTKQTFTLDNTKKYFFYCKLSAGTIRDSIIIKYLDGYADVIGTSDLTNEVGRILSPTKSLVANILPREGDAGTITKESQMFIPMTGKYENYTEEQMLEIARQGYFEGQKECAQNYELVSRGKNLCPTSESDWEQGGIDPNSGILISRSNRIRTRNYIKVKPNSALFVSPQLGSCEGLYIIEYDNYGRFLKSSIMFKKNVLYSISDRTHNLKVFTRLSDDADITPSTISEIKPQLEVDMGQSLGVYEPYQESKTEFSVPKEYPLMELPNGVKNYINDNGDFVANVMKYTIKENDSVLTSTINVGANTLVRCVVPGIKRATAYGKDYGVFAYGYGRLIDWHDNESSDAVGNYAFNANWNRDTIYFIFASGTPFEDATHALVGTVIYYQLAEPLTIKDGENDYKAPTALQAFQNGDLVVTGIYNKEHKLPNSVTTITLDQPLASLGNVSAIVDGRLIDLDAELTDEKTVTLTRPYEGVVQVKGELHRHAYINPVIKADIPANLGSVTSANSKAITETNDKVLSLQDKLDLLMVMNS